MSPEALESFTSLLVELFTPEELRRVLAGSSATQPLVAHLPGAAASAWEVAFQAVALLRRHGLITPPLFRTLEEHRPQQVAAIQACAAALSATPPAQGRVRDIAPEAERYLVVRAEGHGRTGHFPYEQGQTVGGLCDAIVQRWALPSRELANGPVLLRYRYALFLDDQPLAEDASVASLALPNGSLLRLRTQVTPLVAAELAAGSLDGFAFWADVDAEE